MKITATAPTRIDLAGGTIDLWPIHHLLDHKATVNVGITCSATVQISSHPSNKFKLIAEDVGKSLEGDFDTIIKNTELPLFGLLLSHFWSKEMGGLIIHSHAKSPAGAGLGGSSCLAVTLGAALLHAANYKNKNFKLNEFELVQTVQNIEARLIHAPTGCQDYWGAVRGGVNYISYPYSGPHIQTFDSELVAKKLDPLLIACYSGKSRASALNNWEIFKQIFNGDQTLLQKLNEIGKLAEQCAVALQNNEIMAALRASEAEWQIRQSLWPSIETEETKKIDEAAKKAGAYFSRVCGAGGGGVMAVLTPAAKKMQVIEALKKSGGVILDAVVSLEGLKVKID